MKLSKIIILFAILIFSCDDKEYSEDSSNKKELKIGANDSTAIINIAVDSSYTDTTIIISEN